MNDTIGGRKAVIKHVASVPVSGRVSLARAAEAVVLVTRALSGVTGDEVA